MHSLFKKRFGAGLHNPLFKVIASTTAQRRKHDEGGSHRDVFDSNMATLEALLLFYVKRFDDATGQVDNTPKAFRAYLMKTIQEDGSERPLVDFIRYAGSVKCLIGVHRTHTMYDHYH